MPAPRLVIPRAAGWLSLVTALAFTAHESSAQTLVDCGTAQAVPTTGRVIAVGGVASAIVKYDSIFENACWLDSTRAPVLVGLNEPGVQPPSNYAVIEDFVFGQAENIFTVQPLILMGYSHGATMVLRIAHRLQQAHPFDPRLRNISLVLVDRLPTNYPLETVFTAALHSVPPGLGRVLNIFQRVSLTRGAALQESLNTPVINYDVGATIVEEREKARRLVRTTTFPAEGLHDAHHYINFSLAVRRLILGTYDVPYLGGVWSFDITGTVVLKAPPGNLVAITITREFVVQEQWTGDIQVSKELLDPPFGSLFYIKRSGAALQGGGYEFAAAPCSIIGNDSNVTVPAVDQLAFDLNGVYDCDTNELFWDGDFSGTASGRLLIKAGEALLPGVPTGYTANVSGATVTLNWLAPTTGGGPISYRVLAGSSPGASNLADINTNSAATSFVASGVPPGTYFSRVAAVNAQGTGGVSNEITITVLNPGAPLAPGSPGNYQVTVVGSTVTLSWSAPSTGGPPTTYRILAGSTPGASNLADVNTGSTATSFVATSVPSGTYFTRIVAANATGASPPSEEIVLVVGGTLGSPTGLTHAVNGAVVTLNWTAAPGQPTMYVLEAGSLPGATDVGSFATGSAATTVSVTAPPGMYYVRVRAQHASGLSGSSNEVLVIVP